MAISWDTSQPSTPQPTAAPSNGIQWDNQPAPTPDQGPPQSTSEQIWSALAGGATKVTNALGLQGAVNTTGQNLANVFDTSAQQKANMPLTTLKQNVGAGAQIGSMIAAPETAPTSIAGAAGVGALLGGAQAGGGAAANNADAGTITKQTAIGAGAGGATAGALAGLGHLAGNLGDKIQMSVIKPSQADVKDGFSVDTLKKFNLGGTLNQTLEKSQSALQDLSAQLNEKLQGSDATINLQDVFDKTAQQLTSDQGTLKNFGMNTKLGSGLQQLQGEIGSLNAQGGLSIPDAQIVKQAAGGFGAWSYGRPDPESKASEAVYNAFYSNLKTAIEQNSPSGVKEINAQMSKIIPVVNAVIRRIPVAERNNALSLTDMIGLVGSTFHPAALGPTLINLLSKSGAVGNVLSKASPAIGGAAGITGAAAGNIANDLTGQNTAQEAQSQ